MTAYPSTISGGMCLWRHTETNLNRRLKHKQKRKMMNHNDTDAEIERDIKRIQDSVDQEIARDDAKKRREAARAIKIVSSAKKGASKNKKELLDRLISSFSLMTLPPSRVRYAVSALSREDTVKSAKSNYFLFRMAIEQAESVGLEPNTKKKLCYILPGKLKFQMVSSGKRIDRNEDGPIFILGENGLKKLAMKSGQLKGIRVKTLRENGKISGFHAIVRGKDGETFEGHMTLAEAMGMAKRYKTLLSVEEFGRKRCLCEALIKVPVLHEARMAEPMP